MSNKFEKIKGKWIILGVILAIIGGIVGGLIFYSFKSNNKIQENSKSPLPEKPPPPIPFSPPQNLKPPTFRLENISAERKWEWGRNLSELNPKEEKMVIECLSSWVKFDKTKSYFKWYFSMIPAVREVKDDSDEALWLFTDKGNFFVKLNNFSDLSRFEYEKESMLTINEAVPDLAPHPLVLGNLPEGGKFLVVNFMESLWHDRLNVENQKLLAKSLAQLHKKKSSNGKFGFHIGKNNQWKDNWATFFLENRWQPLWKRVLEKYPADQELKKWGTLIGEKVIPDLLGNLAVEPVLIHGNLIFDAWDINSRTGRPWLFDTYSYYGHNEMDLSLIHYRTQDLNWPGGIVPEGEEGEFYESEFLAEYQKYNSLPPGFEKRRDLYRFYDWLFRKIAMDGHPNEKFSQKTLVKIKKLIQKWN